MRPLTRTDAIAAAEARRGTCLTEGPIIGATKVQWRCHDGHEWKATLSSIRFGGWCPKCANAERNRHRRIPVERLHDHASLHGGRCIAVPTPTQPTATWRCKDGHAWKGRPHIVVSRDTWCFKCAAVERAKRNVGVLHHSTERRTIEDLQRAAEGKGGECLSPSFLGQNRHHEWKCAHGHRFMASAAKVLRLGTWCVQCSGSTGERIVRCVFEQVFGTAFPTARPTWLRMREGGYPLQLDGYAEEIQVAFEHQGDQHYKTGWLIKDDESLKARQAADEYKRLRCAAQGITLVLVDQLSSVAGVEPVLEALRTAFAREGRTLPAPMPSAFDLSEAYGPFELALRRQHDIAKSRGGVCLATEYRSAISKMPWRCALGHQWEASPHLIKTGTWCPTCGKLRAAASRRLSPGPALEQLRSIAAERGGLYLASEYRNSSAGMEWRCGANHQWIAPASRIKSGAWCRQCGRARAGATRRARLQERRVAELAVQVDPQASAA
jgi:hypothetical protein